MEDMGISFWNEKKVLVTGHTGFKGTWLTIWLDKLGAKIAGYSLKDYPNDILYKECQLSKKILDTRGDILDFETLNALFKRFNPEIVFHLAAQPLVRVSYEEPIKTFNANILGTSHVLECIKTTDSVQAGVFVTSDKCYENNEWVWGYREDDVLQGQDPYSCSKSCAELVVASYRESYLKKLSKFVGTARAGNVIGGGDWAQDRLIPDCIKSLKENKVIEIRNPQSTRPWQHVLEPLSGYLILAQKLYEKERVDSAWNFGPGLESILPVKDVVEKFIKKWGRGKWIDISNKEELHEAKSLSLDISKAYFLLKWKPRIDIDEALNMTVDWYKKHGKKSSYQMCLKQIQQYEKK
ncbi:CDP-glucose 4,6-dehydratase [Candidatus Woesearchaeota archaeon]|nr:CDP-glucose 4,6-dehydratase [Candidatus Woesearchaeota archaeon]